MNKFFFRQIQRYKNFSFFFSSQLMKFVGMTKTKWNRSHSGFLFSVQFLFADRIRRFHLITFAVQNVTVFCSSRIKISLDRERFPRVFFYEYRYTCNLYKITSVSTDKLEQRGDRIYTEKSAIWRMKIHFGETASHRYNNSDQRWNLIIAEYEKSTKFHVDK